VAKAKSERNYYPHIVVGMILGMVVACTWVIKIAVSNPVEMDTYYMEKYQKVDHNINEILALQAKFDAAFNLGYSTDKFVMGSNTVTLKLTDKNGQAINDANIQLMLSRPETNQENKELKASKVQNGEYTFGPFEINKPGRWQILSKITVGEYKGYHKSEAYASK
jgi:nitrogen fixation protein FixH